MKLQCDTKKPCINEKTGIPCFHLRGEKCKLGKKPEFMDRLFADKLVKFGTWHPEFLAVDKEIDEKLF